MSNFNSFINTLTKGSQNIENVQSMGTAKSLKIILLGPSLLQQGGISNYEKLFLEYAPSEVQICHIVTHEEGTTTFKIISVFECCMEVFVDANKRRG